MTLDDLELPLMVINTNIALRVCAEECGSKCCDFYLNDFVARVNIEDYKLLQQHDLDHFIIWDHGDPQLVKQPGGECIFLHPQSKQCTIYDIRPLDCRNFPYFMPEDNIADHCLLYYNSSDELIEREREKTHDVPEFTKHYNELDAVERKYISNLEQQPLPDTDHLLYEELLQTNTSYMSIIYEDDDALHQALQYVKRQREDLQEDTYQVLSVIGMTDAFEANFHILGVIRSSESVTIPHLKHFPSTIEELEEILNYVNQHDYQRLTAGILLSPSQYEQISKKV